MRICPVFFRLPQRLCSCAKRLWKKWWHSLLRIIYELCIAEKSWDKIKSGRESAMKIFIVNKRQKITWVLASTKSEMFSNSAWLQSPLKSIISISYITDSNFSPSRLPSLPCHSQCLDLWPHITSLLKWNWVSHPICSFQLYVWGLFLLMLRHLKWHTFYAMKKCQIY